MVRELSAFKQAYAYFPRENGFSGRLLRGVACRNHRPIAFGSETCRYAKGTKEGKKSALQKESLVRVLDLVQGTGVYC